MKRIIPIAFGILAVAASTFAQDAIQKALLAAPARQKKEDVTVIKWKPDFTYDTLQKGSSSMVCYDLSGYPGHPAFTIECTSTGNLKRVAQNLKFEALGDKAKTQAAFDAAEKDGSREKPEFGSAFIHFMGPDQEHANHHTTISVPNATSQTIGMPEKPNPRGTWIRSAGTTAAHIMIPGS